MKTMPREVIARLRFKNARCPICGGTHQVDCPGEEVEVQGDDHLEKEHRSCSNGCLSGMNKRHSLCNGTGRVTCKYCNEDGVVGAFILLIVQIGKDATKRFAFMKKPKDDLVLCPQPIRYVEPCGNGSGKFLSFWTKSGSKYPKEESKRER